MKKAFLLSVLFIISSFSLKAQTESDQAANGLDNLFTSIADKVVPGLGTLIGTIADNQRIRKEEAAELKDNLKEKNMELEDVQTKAKTAVNKMSDYFAENVLELEVLKEIFDKTLKFQQYGFSMLAIKEAINNNPPASLEEKKKFVKSFILASNKFHENFEAFQTKSLTTSVATLSGILANYNDNFRKIDQDITTRGLNITTTKVSNASDDELNSMIIEIKELNIESFEGTISSAGNQLVAYLNSHKQNVEKLDNTVEDYLGTFD